MKKTLIILSLSSMPLWGYSQFGSFIKKVENKAISKVNSRIDRAIDRAMDKTLDEVEGKNQKTSSSSTSNPTTTISTKQQSVDETISSYVKYDFVPGEKIIYSNDFATDVLGELPIGWNSNGTGAVATLNGLKGNWALLHQNSTYLTDNKEDFSEDFTVEFDLVLRRNNPKAPFPVMVFGVLASGDYAPTDSEIFKGLTNTFATELKIQPYDNGSSFIHLQTWQDKKKYLSTDIKRHGVIEQYYNKTINIAMQLQKERLRMWFNEVKLYDLPKAITSGIAINQLYFDVKRYGGADDEVGYAVSNIKIAKGLPDTRHKLIEEGVFSTTGIQFDINSATIKPESNGVCQEIAAVLMQFPDTKIKIVGHTDSDGADATNLELSKRRATSVKEILTKDFGIDAQRMESDGKGESAPVGDNKTKEGKAQNRRVEFIKL
jgi:OmpA-OmpF porin, OOP family